MPPKAPNPGHAAKMAKKLTDSAAMIERLTAGLKEKQAEIDQLKEHVAAQDQVRRTKETEHSDELLLILRRLDELKELVSTKPLPT